VEWQLTFLPCISELQSHCGPNSGVKDPLRKKCEPKHNLTISTDELACYEIDISINVLLTLDPAASANQAVGHKHIRGLDARVFKMLHCLALVLRHGMKQGVVHL